MAGVLANLSEEVGLQSVQYCVWPLGLTLVDKYWVALLAASWLPPWIRSQNTYRQMLRCSSRFLRQVTRQMIHIRNPLVCQDGIEEV
jgi:hypothetical protein